MLHKLLLTGATSALFALLAGCGDNSAASPDTAGTSSASTTSGNAVVVLSAANYSLPAQSADEMFSVNRRGAATGSTTVDYSTVNGTATAGADYSAVSGTL